MLDIAPKAQIAEEAKEVRDAQTVILERTMGEQKNGQTVINEVTGSDKALIQARADYATLANKVLGMEDFLDYFNNRFDREAPAPVNRDVVAEQVFSSEDGQKVMTGAEIVNLAEQDAAADFNEDARDERQAQMESMGEKAFDIYRSIYIEEASRYQEIIREAADERRAEIDQVQQTKRERAVANMRERIEKFVGERAYLRFLDSLPAPRRANRLRD